MFETGQNSGYIFNHLFFNHITYNTRQTKHMFSSPNSKKMYYISQQKSGKNNKNKII